MGRNRHREQEQDPYVSVAAAARTLGVSRPTVYARVAAGRLEQRTIAGRLVITRESLDRLVAEMDTNVTATAA